MSQVRVLFRPLFPMNLSIAILPETFAVCTLPRDERIPAWVFNLPFWSVMRSDEEISLILADEIVPSGWTSNRGWRALKVEGPLDFTLTGILASIATPLAQASISIFALSTYNTDFVLVKSERLQQAIQSLANAGFKIIATG
jgi:hypothetical protein